MRSSLETLDAKVWMDERFYMYESQPNSKEIHIDSTYKLSIFEEYVKDMKAEKDGERGQLAESKFRELWTICYSLAKIRAVKRVSGKCWTCAYIHEVNDIRFKSHFSSSSSSSSPPSLLSSRCEIRNKVRWSTKPARSS